MIGGEIAPASDWTLVSVTGTEVLVAGRARVSPASAVVLGVRE